MKYLLEAEDVKMQAWKDRAKVEGVSFAVWLRRAADGALMEPDAGVVAESQEGGGRAQKSSEGDSRMNPRDGVSGSVSAPLFAPASPNIGGVPFRGGKRSYEPDPR